MAYDSKKAKQIWQTVCCIPKGKVSSYGQIADLAGLPKRARLVGKVLGFSPDSMQVPWHRVLRSDGKIASRPKSDEQRILLMEEGIMVVNSRVKMDQYAWRPSLTELLQLEF